MKHDEYIISVARRYRQGAFSVKDGWKRLGLGPVSWWTVKKTAAAACIAIVLSASAGILIHNSLQEPTQAGPQSEEHVAPRYAVVAIDFEEAPLPIVLETIRDTYSVEIVNRPDDADRYRLTLHYEGNADELIATINDILGTEMSIKE